MQTSLSFRRALICAVLPSFTPFLLAAQAPLRNGPRPVLPRADEIALARSAAPPEVSTGSRVWVFTGTSYVVADSGSTGVNCYVGRPWGESLEPHCFDPEGSTTILPIQIRRVELYVSGKSQAEVESDIAAGILSGRYRLPARPAVSYMMSAAQNLVTDAGTRVGSWRPHLMIYHPFITAAELGLVQGAVPGMLFLENEGRALAALIVPLTDFVPAPAGR